MDKIIQFRGKPRSSYQNLAEQLFLEFSQSKGWRVTKRGWPDFLCRSVSGEWFAVEVKPRLPNGEMAPLKMAQIACMDWLTSLGVRCYVADGFKMHRYGPRHRNRPAPTRRRRPRERF